MVLPEAPAPAPEPDVEPSGSARTGAPLIDLTSLLPERSAQDILAGEVRIKLGRRRGGAIVLDSVCTYLLPVLAIAPNRKWKAGLEDGLLSMLGVIEEAGDDFAGIMAAFKTATPQMLDALYAYDQAGLLPPREELEEYATDAEVLRATLEVWSAANPFAEVALSAMREAERKLPPTIGLPANDSSTPTNGARRSTAGRRQRSRRS